MYDPMAEQYGCALVGADWAKAEIDSDKLIVEKAIEYGKPVVKGAIVGGVVGGLWAGSGAAAVVVATAVAEGAGKGALTAAVVGAYDKCANNKK